MVLADDTLFVAGPPEVLEETEVNVRKLMHNDELARQTLDKALAAWEGEEGASLWAISTVDGKRIAEQPLKTLPVFDGMAAANNCLYIVTQQGDVICLGGST